MKPHYLLQPPGGIHFKKICIFEAENH